MSKEEFLKIQTCVLKVNIHCDGCKQKVKKILQKIDGVYTTSIDSEQGKVTVSGNVDPSTLIKKLTKNGKHAEIWGASKPVNPVNPVNPNQSQINNSLKNLHVDNGKGGNNKGQSPKGSSNNQPKSGPQVQNPQLQQLQLLKGLQDQKLPPQFLKGMKDQNQKSVKFNLPEDEGMTDDEFDDFDDDDDDDDDEDSEFDDDEDDGLDDEVDNKMNPVVGNGHGGSHMVNGMMNAKKVGGNIPLQMNLGGNDPNGGKKGINNGGGQKDSGKNVNLQSQGIRNGGQNNSSHVGATNGINGGSNGDKKGDGTMYGDPRGPANMMAMMGNGGGGNLSQIGKHMPTPQMGNLPLGGMSNPSAIQGLPAPAMNGGGSGGAGHFPNGQMAGNPMYQQQLAAMMMNQQRANGNERFHPMMYARPPPAVNYMPPYPPYPYPQPPGAQADQYAMFSDENTSSCSVM